MKLELSESKKFLLIREATELEYEQVKSSFTKKIEGWRYHPLVKRGIWSGEISFVSGNKVPSGLWKELMDTMTEFGMTAEIEGLDALFDYSIDKEEFASWVTDFFEGYEKFPRDYQIDTAFRILKFRRCIAELATSAGKSLIIFMVIAYLLEKEMVKRVLLIVPNVSLVIQASEDFTEYNHKNRLKLKIQQIYAGQKIKKDCNIVIGTYQSLVKKKVPYYEDIDIVIVDECLHPNTMISMADGSFKKIKDVKKGESVITINEKTYELQPREVEYVYKNLSQNQQMYEIEMDDGRILKVTGNHKIRLTSGEWKRVDELNEGDDILSK